VNLPSGATDTRHLVDQLNALLGQDKQEAEVVEVAVRGLIDIVGKLEAALRELDRRMGAARRMHP
jgi:hypothetical protein